MPPHPIATCFLCYFVPQRTDPSFTYEVIIVDDGSQDGTAEVRILVDLSSVARRVAEFAEQFLLRDPQCALAYGKKHNLGHLYVLRLTANRGKGGAVRMVSCGQGVERG